MAIILIRFINVILIAIIAGILCGVWLGYNPKELSAHTYIEQQQSVINAFNVLMPILGLITIIITVIGAFLQRPNRNVFITLLIAAAFLIIAGLVTRFGNQPINSIVMTWKADAPPGNWIELRDKWWSLHIVRTFSSFVALCLIVWASIKKS
jgi:C4-dicarboxylate transporter